VNKFVSRVNVARAAVSAGLMTVGFSAFAALPTAATAAMTQLEDDADALITAAWPVIAAVTVGFIIIKLFKRGGSKV
jgi:hypothetical protein